MKNTVTRHDLQWRVQLDQFILTDRTFPLAEQQIHNIGWLVLHLVGGLALIYVERIKIRVELK